MIWTLFLILVAGVYFLTGLLMLGVVWFAIPVARAGEWRAPILMSLACFLVAAAALRGLGTPIP